MEQAVFWRLKSGNACKNPAGDGVCIVRAGQKRAAGLLYRFVASALRWYLSGGRVSASTGKEIAPGVRQVDLGKARASMIPAYKNVSMRDVVYQPKAKTSNPGMNNDMVCHCAEGELRIKQGPGMEFVAKKRDVWSCNKGLPEDSENIASGVSIMRVIDFDLA